MFVLQSRVLALPDPTPAQYSITVVEHGRLPRRHAKDWFIGINRYRVVFAGFDHARFGCLTIANLDSAGRARYRSIG